jgi:hypothetical protein
MILGFLFVVLAQEGAPSSFVAATEQSLSLDLPLRIDMISKSLLGLPYVLDAEGEGDGYDPDPLQNFQGMDCLTYVEAVLAFSMSRSWEGALDIRNDIRYFEQEVHYENRKHFMFSQWIPSNLEHGYIQEISSQIGETESMSRIFDDRLWDQWKGKNKIPLPKDDFPKGEFGLDVLSIDEALENIDRIPSGALLVVVRDSNIGNPVLISHIGFVIDAKTKKGMVKKMRHATIMGSPKGVKEHQLRWYLNHMKNYPYRWKVKGISIFYPKFPNGLDILIPKNQEDPYTEGSYEVGTPE